MNKNVPNILTVLRIILVPFFIFFYEYNMMVTALVIFIVASVTDYFDGKLARKYNIVSNFGKFMDPLADKILTYSAFCLFVSENFLHPVFLIIVLFREFAVAGIRMLAASNGKVIAADMFGKIKTVLQMVGIPMGLLCKYIGTGSSFGNVFYYLTMAVLYLSLFMTILSGYNYIAKNIEVIKDED